uniref:Short neuropeptide F n=1 Tax=Panagrellus redivivus TaxID=6233 RepID=A0A7E4VF35_PANRE
MKVSTLLLLCLIVVASVILVQAQDDYIPEEELLTLMKKGRPRGPPRFGKRSSGEPRAYYRLTRPSLTLFRPMTGLLTDNPYL